MKVYVHLEEGDPTQHMTLKITLPKKWNAGPASNIKTTFVEAYNKRKGASLDPAALHMRNSRSAARRAPPHPENHTRSVRGKLIKDDAVVEEALQDRADVFVCGGAPGPPHAAARARPPPPAVAAAAAVASAAAADAAAGDEPLLRCRNYGCQATFRESQNSDAACRHHAGPPIFHEVRKGWTCCPDRMVYDWEEFMKLEGCAVGRHSTVDPQVQFAASPTVARAAAAESKPGPEPQLRSIDDFNRENKDAPTAARSIAAAVRRKRSKVLPDGRVQCVNPGCQQFYRPDDNSDTACRHHAREPVFHDTLKWWGCCEHRKVTDFDEFMCIPPCQVGPHVKGDTD